MGFGQPLLMCPISCHLKHSRESLPLPLLELVGAALYEYFLSAIWHFEMLALDSSVPNGVKVGD